MTSPPGGLTELPDELLARVLELAAPRDLEAVTVACKTVALHVLPRFPLWKALFCYRWAMLNFPLLGDAQSPDKSVTIEIDPRLRELFPSNVTESRMYQLLAHAITPVPSYADVDATMRFRKNTWMDHTIVSLGKLDSGTRQLKPRPLDFAFAGCDLGGNRSVRANAPFPTTFHVQVFKVRASNGACSYKVGITASGYFEITISKRECPCGAHRVAASDMTAIGVGSHSFRLTDKQPGWDADSYGYHGDDGHFFHRTGRGRDFGPSFDVGDTVGCGVRRNMREQHSSAFFTLSGDLIPTGGRGIECEHEDWFPVVGLDSANAVHVNYGQEPFRYDAIVDELFDECHGQAGVLANQLQWYNISESDIETSSDEEMSEGSSTDQDDFDDFFDEDEESAAENDSADFLHRLLLFSRGFGGSSHEDEEDSLLEFEDADDE
ncbi:hypothetical protein Gpo141_00003650 [Globisporangium polare]